MKNEHNHIENLIAAYLDGELNNNQKELVDAHLNNCDSCCKALAAYQNLFKAFEEEAPAIPSLKLREGFLEMLEAEKKEQAKVVPITPAKQKPRAQWFPLLLKVAASMILLSAAFLMGKYTTNSSLKKERAIMQQQALQTKQVAMISLLENRSASKRIQGVQLVDNFLEPDEAIINALADRMLNDANTNVRLLAAEALSKFRHSELVKVSFIAALKTEKDPSIQIAIIQNLVEMQEKKAIEPMKELLKQEDTQLFIKEEINTSLLKMI